MTPEYTPPANTDGDIHKHTLGYIQCYSQQSLSHLGSARAVESG